MPGINELVQEESKKIVNKYLSQINDRITRPRRS